MKRIYLLRHGKAEDSFDKSDFDRELIPKGKKKTTKVAQYLKKNNIAPQKILVSMAQRTIQTAEVLSDILSLSKDAILVEKSLYLASSNSILDVLYGVDDQIQELMLIGHNPGLSSLATYLAGQEIDWMPTSGLVGIEIDIDKWTDIAGSPSRLLFYIKPNDL